MSPPPPACQGLQWPGVAMGITSQEVGPDYNSLVKEYLSMFCYMADLISSCVSPYIYFFHFTFKKHTPPGEPNQNWNLEDSLGKGPGNVLELQ